MAETQCVHGPDCPECKANREALQRIIRRATTIIKDDIFDLATPEELDVGRFDRLISRADEMVTDAVERASAGYAGDLTVEGFIRLD